MLKFMLKIQSVRILLNSASYLRVLHSNSNGVDDTQIRACMQKLERVKVQVSLVHMVGLDHVARLFSK